MLMLLEAPAEIEAEKPLDEAGLLLNKAADIMERLGMARWTVQDGAGRVCVMGALNLADHGSPHYCKKRYTIDWSKQGLRALRFAEDPYVQAVRRTWDEVGQEPWLWNNEVARDTHEVVSAMRKAARRS